MSRVRMPQVCTFDSKQALGLCMSWHGACSRWSPLAGMHGTRSLLPNI